MPTGDTKKSKVLLVSSVTQPQPKLTKDKETPPTATLESSSDSQRRGCEPSATAAGQSLLPRPACPSLGGGGWDTHPRSSRVRVGQPPNGPGARSVQTEGRMCHGGKIGDRGVPLQATQAPAFREQHSDCSLQQLRIHPKGSNGTTGQWLAEVYGSSLTGVARQLSLSNTEVYYEQLMPLKGQETRKSWNTEDGRKSFPVNQPPLINLACSLSHTLHPRSELKSRTQQWPLYGLSHS